MRQNEPAIQRLRDLLEPAHRGERTLVMGILNVTPDSFSDGGLFLDPAMAIDHAKRMADEGADMIDIGGQSTRATAAPLSEEDEMKRVLPIIEAIAASLSTPISIDTYKSKVARRAVEAGAAMVNDISALTFDPEMASTIAELGV